MQINVNFWKIKKNNMKFIQKEDGSCDLEFSFKERLLLIRKGKLHFDNETFKHFSNHLGHMVMQWNLKFDDKLKNLQTDSSVKTEAK